MSSVWSALTGGNKPSQQQQPQQQQYSEPTTTYESTSFDPSQGQGVEAFLQNSSFADPSQLHPLAGLSKDSLEYLTLDETALSDPGHSVLPSRGFTDDLCYGAGVTYLAGLSLGGAWGLQEGLRKSGGQPPRLRLNTVLNAVTRRGPFLGNSAGVVAIVYNLTNSLIGYLRGKHDSANTIAAGMLSGMLFKSTRGVRQMMISGGIVGSVAGAWAIVRRSFFPTPEQQREAPVEASL
jgi:import inner membrane translocase subunit TIM23